MTDNLPLHNFLRSQFRPTSQSSATTSSVVALDGIIITYLIFLETHNKSRYDQATPPPHAALGVHLQKGMQERAPALEPSLKRMVPRPATCLSTSEGPATARLCSLPTCRPWPRVATSCGRHLTGICARHDNLAAGCLLSIQTLRGTIHLPFEIIVTA